jgi:Fibronectin type III domain
MSTPRFRQKRTGAATIPLGRGVVGVVTVIGAALLAAGSTPDSGSAAAPLAVSPPSVPQGMAFAGKTRTTVNLVWRASTDDIGVTGYRLYRNGTRVATVPALQLRYTFSGLRCGTRYTFALEALDALRNASNRAEATGSIATSACATAAAKPPPKPAPAPPRAKPKPKPTPKPPPKSGTANVWIDPSGGSCTRKATAAPYSDSQACGSLQAAYTAAAANDTVSIADGTYGNQGLGGGTKAVTFRAAGPGRPSFGQIVSAASNITVRGILIQDRGSSFNGPCTDPDNAVLYPCGANQTFDNVVVDGLNDGGDHGIRGVGRGFKLRNSVVRNILNQKGFEAGADDMLIENTLWHHITVSNADVHNECMYVNGGDRSVYRGNRFIGCPTMALFFTNSSDGSAYRDVIVENNVFGHTLDDDGDWHSSCAFKIGSGGSNQNTIHGWQVRYNTFETGTCVDDLPGGGSTWIGNLGGISCVKAFTYRYNVGQVCGGTGDFASGRAVNSRTTPNQAPFYVNAPGGDFRLKAGAAAINRGDPKTYPRTDRTRKQRPVGSAPDAGAYEYGS